MSITWSFRPLPPEMREEAIARSKIVQQVLRTLHTKVMPRAEPMDIDLWEQTLAQGIVPLITEAQAANAALVDKTMNLELMANGWQDTPIGVLNPQGFAGFTPDGDPLEMIPRAVAKHVRERLALYEEPSVQQRRQAWESGGKLLATIAQTALIDTQRMAKSVAELMRPKTLYVRKANVPCWARCAILAGKRGYWDKPFKRHPGCDCTQIAVPEGTGAPPKTPEFSVQAYWDSLSARDQEKVFGKAGAAAIRSGADINQVVNSRSGMSAAGSAFTTVGTTQRSQTMRYYYGKPTGSVRGMARVPRLSVPEIIRQTQGDARARTALLFQHGYIRSVQPGVLPREVFDLVADPARVRQQALFEEFAEIVPLIDPALPLEHITKAGGARYVPKRGLIYVTGGHTSACSEETVSSVRHLLREFPNARLSSPKSFFPPQPDEQLLRWLEDVSADVLNYPDFLDRTGNDGWLLQKSVVDAVGNRMRLEMIIQANRANEEYSWKKATIFARHGDKVKSITRDGQIVDVPWEG
ncbi:hypothetical protein [Corynebacterium renale]|uniref:Uncharacterized protein n=1 Tax=Corynebacterium renale TaxID=1724 RepID=A0A2A9DQ73_9CORY|nr:hypothetical protein [Corynebacterium renale]PFG28315.1 hypothetical protein ATK06_1422 [Corynebacterium renale]SQI19035.1 Uncharacterised protein [Corynebacterium renale]